MSDNQTPESYDVPVNESSHKKTFTEEYLDFLNAFEIEYDERFLFKSVG